MMEGGMQSADEALAGEDVRTLRTLAALTGGMWENKGPKWCGSEEKWAWPWAREVPQNWGFPFNISATT